MSHPCPLQPVQLCLPLDYGAADIAAPPARRAAPRYSLTFEHIGAAKRAAYRRRCQQASACEDALLLAIEGTPSAP